MDDKGRRSKYVHGNYIVFVLGFPRFYWGKLFKKIEDESRIRRYTDSHFRGTG